MKLKEFLDKTGMTRTTLAKHTGLKPYQLDYIYRGQGTTLINAVILSEYSKRCITRQRNGMMEPKDFLTKEQQEQLDKAISRWRNP